MSIPQICPNCGNHISEPHDKDCCYGTPEYAHLGWPSSVVLTAGDGVALKSISHPGWSALQDSIKEPTFEPDTASAIRRLLDYLNDEPDEAESATPVSSEELCAQDRVSTIMCRLAKKCEELRKEAAGIHLVEARAKRIFTVGILEGLIEELNEA